LSALFTGSDLTRATGAKLADEITVCGISIDTRTLKPGDLFIALRTESGDGHRFLAKAKEAGAAAAIVDHLPQDMPAPPLLVVPDTQKALTDLGEFSRARFKGKVVAVTGSVGKTTTKEMLRHILSANGKTHAALASYNNHWGVPLTLALCPPDAEYAVIEIGMNNPGEIAPLACLARPHVGVITTIASAHIGNMGGIEAIADEKASIMQGILSGGTVIVPQDTPHLQRLANHAPKNIRVITCGAHNIVQVMADDHGSNVAARIADLDIVFRVNAAGRHMVDNAITALQAAVALGADLPKSAGALEQFTAQSGRGARIALLGGEASLLDESYNANTASVRAALGILSLIPAQRRIAVLGDMLELGEFSRSEHLSLADALRESADVLYACGPMMKFLYDYLPPTMRGAYEPDSTSLAPRVAANLRAGDAILVKGSLGSKMRVVVEALIAAAA